MYVPTSRVDILFIFRIFIRIPYCPRKEKITCDIITVLDYKDKHFI